MKKIFTLTISVLFTAIVWAQSPQLMSYQAVIRDGNSNLVQNHVVAMRISILQGTTPVYVEIQTPTTNVNGMVNIEIGSVVPVSGTIASIDWSLGIYSIKTETDPTGGTNYTAIVGTSQLLSVPYALHATTAENISGTIAETDPVYTGSQAANITANDITKLNNLSGSNTGDQDLSGLATTSAVTIALDMKVDKVTGKGLSTNDFTTAEQSKLALMATGTTPGQMQYWDGTAWITVAPGTTGQTLSFCYGVPTWGPCTLQVLNPITGKIWMDRNLGASQVATSSTDAAAYGDLYQWGRGADGHQLRTSLEISTLSDTDVTGNANFILAPGYPNDWRSPQNTNLWQGLNGVNNPCPAGFRIPTSAEFDAERASWSSPNIAGAFGSPLKLTAAGYRDASNGFMNYLDSNGFYWTSDLNTTESDCLTFYDSGAFMYTDSRADGFSIRCIKD